MKVLQSYNFKLSKLIKKLVSLAYKCSSKIEFFTTDMCHIISEIREPLTDEPLSEKEQRERDIKVSISCNITRTFILSGNFLSSAFQKCYYLSV